MEYENSCQRIINSHEEDKRIKYFGIKLQIKFLVTSFKTSESNLLKAYCRVHKLGSFQAKALQRLALPIRVQLKEGLKKRIVTSAVLWPDTGPTLYARTSNQISLQNVGNILKTKYSDRYFEQTHL